MPFDERYEAREQKLQT